MVNTIPRPPVYKVFIWQALATLLIFVILFPLGRVQSYSFLLGCLIQISGSLYFARLAFRYTGARQMSSAVQAMYRGESGKIVLTIALFAAVFSIVKPVDAIAVFVGYLAMLGLNLALTARILKQRNTIH